MRVVGLVVNSALWAIVIVLVLANCAAPSEGPDASVTVKGYIDVPVLRGAPQPLPRPSVSPVHSASGQAIQPSGAPPLSGFATWCGPTPTQCQGWGGDAMLGAVPSFRFGDEPYRVRVTRGERSVVVTVLSFCACRDRHGVPTVLDMSPAAFEQLAPLSRGVVRVEMAPVSWKGME